MTRSRKLGWMRCGIFLAFVVGLVGPWEHRALVSAPLAVAVEAIALGKWLALIHLGLWIVFGAMCLRAAIRGSVMAIGTYCVLAGVLLLEVLLFTAFGLHYPSFPDDWGLFLYAAALAAALLGEFLAHLTDPARLGT